MVRRADARTSGGRSPTVVEMQSEGGAAGAVHGALQAGALATTFTASQGLLLMIPNMYKIAGELTPFCMHVAARTVATHALSIFGDHSDVMACRQTGFAMLASGSVQEAHDFAAIAQAATLAVPRSVPPLLRRVPHLARGGEDRGALRRGPARRCSTTRLIARAPRPRPDARPPGAARHAPRIPTSSSRPARPATASTSPARASCSETMDRFAELTGRDYGLFDYVGHPEAERVIVLMGSGAEAVARDRRLARRPRREGRVWSRSGSTARFDVERFVARAARERRAPSPSSTAPRSPARSASRSTWTSSRRCREARDDGCIAREPRVIGGRYGLSSKEFTPAMVKAVFDELARGGAAQPLHRRHRRRRDPRLSLPYDRELRHRARRRGPGGLLRAGRGRDGRREQEHDQDHRRDDGQLRPGLLRLRLEEVGRDDHLAPAFRPRPDPLRVPRSARRASSPATSSSSSNRYDVLEHAAPGADLPPQLPLRSRRGLGPAAPRGPGADHREAIKLYVIDAYRGRARDRHEAAASTRSCRPASSRSPACSRARRRSRRSRKRSRRPTARRAARSCGATSPRSTGRSRPSPRSRFPSGSRRERRRPDVVLAGGARLRAAASRP